MRARATLLLLALTGTIRDRSRGRYEIEVESLCALPPEPRDEAFWRLVEAVRAR
ncbi:hypothetical protein [Sandaracinus amylolyticus]|uniref:hypothetical protein n=1 Tax=Sandaracinus amylolyticus TaxID=927083 RepID=UPI001F4285D8|nr:hypothetical protein [Sandaracinus amylolyticus]UJR85809.1 Hypothetical protein I5071_78890 [Sandaracinus amylolyticus]